MPVCNVPWFLQVNETLNTISLIPPIDFIPAIVVAGCYCEYENKILLLERSPHKFQGNTWGVPGGKLDEGETPVQAVIREVFEEVGIEIQEDDLQEMDIFYVRRPPSDYIFHRFRVRFSTLPLINLGLEEHVQARWVTVEEALELPLIYGGKESLLNYKKFIFPVS